MLVFTLLLTHFMFWQFLCLIWTDGSERVNWFDDVQDVMSTHHCASKHSQAASLNAAKSRVGLRRRREKLKNRVTFILDRRGERKRGTEEFREGALVEEQVGGETKLILSR